VNEKEVSMKPRDIGGNKRGFLKPKKWKTSK
jgi:hypothetical protein